MAGWNKINYRICYCSFKKEEWDSDFFYIVVVMVV